jgi:DNA polymerase I-like protein with 3'-5' exonuclease and polymerase domains
LSNLFLFDTGQSPLPTPNTGWLPPRDFPNLAAAYCIGRDRETKELDFDNGPGWARGKGYVIGESVTAYDRDLRPTSWYFPMRHEVEPEYNLDPDQVRAYCRDVDRLPTTKVYANSLYDCGYGLDATGEMPNGDLHDVQFAEAILSETDLTALDALGWKYLDQGKLGSQLYQWCANNYGGEPTGKQRANLYRTSPRLAGPYAEEDSSMLLPILMKQIPLLREQQLYNVYRMECELVPLLVKMRKRGVRIDLDKATRLFYEMGPLIDGLENDLFKMTGVEANVDASTDLAKVFDAVGLPYPRTEKGNPSFTAEFLNAVEHPVGHLVVSIRQHKKLKSTFLKNYILDSHNNGRIHGQYHPLKGESGGTRVGRLSSSTPNLQNIPSRTALGRKIRELFIPDIGSLYLEKGDHSQLQYRALAHFAVDALGNNKYGDGPSSNALRDEYNLNPRTDYHTRTQKMVNTVSGLYIPRSSEEASQGELVKGTELYDAEGKMIKGSGQYTEWGTGRFTIKETNFGLMFGMGKKKLIRQAGFVGKTAEQKGEDIFNAYHQGNPYVKATMDCMSLLAQRQGFVTTVMGRRTRFDMWVKCGYHDPPLTPLRYDAAIREWGTNIERAGTYKALCNELQGTEGEIIKMGMLACYKEGLFDDDLLGPPLLTTHDELVTDIKNESPEVQQARERYGWLMENALRIRVPLVYERTTGPDWGNAKIPV